MKCWLILLARAACTRPNPRLCQNGACSDPQYPFCDVDGVLGGEPLTCISVSCSPLEFAGCRGDLAIVCNQIGNDYDLINCDRGCDDTEGGCKGETLEVLFASQVAETTTSGGPVATPRLVPLTAVDVRFGSLDGAFAAASFDPATGVAVVPRSGLGSSWRLEYTLEDGVAREIQWGPQLEGTPQVIAPVFGRLDRATVPPGSGYEITTSGAGDMAPYASPRVLTTGVWTITNLGPSSPSPIQLPFNSVKAVSGQLGQPEASRGDQGVFVAYNSDAYCSYARGTAKFAPPALQPGMLSPVTANWSVPLNPNIRFDYSEAAADTTRLTAVLGDRAGSQSSGVHTGFIPNNAMPVLSDDPLQLGIPSPPMLSLADCMLGTTNPTAFADLPLFGFPRLAYAHFEDRRTVSGASLISAVAGASISSNNVFDIHLRIPLVIRPIQLAVEGGAHFDLGGPADGVEVPRSSSPLRLSFELEPILDAVVHSLHVDLYKLATGRLRHTRSYTITDVLQRELVLDGSVLEPGEYVFAISARRGTPRAVAGDFATVSYPQAVSRVFTRTFVVP